MKKFEPMELELHDFELFGFDRTDFDLTELKKFESSVSYPDHSSHPNELSPFPDNIPRLPMIPPSALVKVRGPSPLDSFFERLGRPAVFAHRGASGHAVENSLEALRLAWEKGADGVEFDVQACASGELVVFHDRTLTRLTGALGQVQDWSWKDLKTLELPSTLPHTAVSTSEDAKKRLRGQGAANGAKASPLRIPLLDQWLEAAPDGLFLNLEVKASTAQNTFIAKACVEALQRHGKEGQAVISSFHPLALHWAKRGNRKVPRAMLVNAETRWRLILSSAATTSPRAIHADHRLISASRVRLWKSLGLRVMAWTVDDPEVARRCLQAGVDGLITNHPERIRALVD